MINNLYYGSDDVDIDCFRNASFKFDTDVLATFLRRIYNGFDTSKDVEPTMWREILRIINEATVDGLVKGNYDTNIDKTFLQKLAHSNEVFSAFKVHNMGVDMAKKMRTDDGKLKPFSEWKKDIKGIASHYCGAWLQTEYNTATLRAKFAAEWKQYEADADIMPNLRWMPTTSANPEEEHKEYWMKRLTLPVEHSFWNSHFPGDHWNCKCSLEQTDEQATLDLAKRIRKVEAQDGLKRNPGKTGEMFDESHPYIASLDKEEQRKVLAALEKQKRIDELAKTLPDNISREDRYAIAENRYNIEQILGVKQGKPMTIEEADKQSANPNYGKSKGFQINCSACTSCYTLREWGFNIVAGENTETSKIHEFSREKNTKLWYTLWRNPDGTPVSFESAKKWAAQKYYRETLSTKMYREFYEEKTKDPGTYIVSLAWSARSGHVTILKRFPNGGLVRIEPQRDNSKGSKNDWDDFDFMCKKSFHGRIHESRGILRVDDKLFDEGYLSMFEVP